MAALPYSKIQYVGSVEWTAMSAWVSNHSYAAGVLVNNSINTPAVGNERALIAIVAGTSAPSAQPNFGVGKGNKTVDNTVTWMEVTGQPVVNGDITNPQQWVASSSTSLGQTIYDPTSLAGQIITTSNGNTGASKPTFSATAGITTGDSNNIWTSLGHASNFSPWAAPHARILNADAAGWQTVVPATIFISSDHNEIQGSAMTLANGQATAAKQNQYLSVSTAAAPPTSCTIGATATTSGANAMTINANSAGYYYGISFVCGSGATGENLSLGELNQYDNFKFTLGTTGLCAFTLNNTNGEARTIFNNCIFICSAVTQNFNISNVQTEIIGGSIASSGSVPSILFRANTNSFNNLKVRDCNLSQVTTTLFLAAVQNGGTLQIQNCELGSGVAMTVGAWENAGAIRLKVHNCDSGSKNYRFYESDYLGTVQHETTIIDNTNPASNGNQTISWNIAPTANTAFGQPFISPEIARWSAITTGTHTATLQMNNTNGTLNNGQLWMELECLDNSGFPIGSVITSRVADALTATSNYSTSSDSWGGSLTNAQSMQVSFTPQMAGYIKARVYVAAQTSALSNLYISPILLVV